MMQAASVDTKLPSCKTASAEATKGGEAAKTSCCWRLRWRLLVVGLCLSAVVFCAHGLFRTLVSRTLHKQASQMHLQPTLIFLDAPEDREHAVVRVDALVHTGHSRTHEIKLSDAACTIQAGSGAEILRMHAEQVHYVEANKVHFDTRLDHGVVQDAMSELEASQGVTMVSCDVGLKVDLFKTGWIMRIRREMSFPIGRGSGERPKVRFVREAQHATPPTFTNFTATAEANYRLEVAMPLDQAQSFFDYFQGAPVHILGAVSFAEEDVGSVQASFVVDSELQHWLEERLDRSPHVVFALPLRVRGRTDVAALAASTAALATGEEAELDGRHYHVRPTKDGRHHGRRHAVAMAATSPQCPLARALGVEHVLSLEEDEDGPTLPETLANGRKLLERKLAGATLEGYGIRLGLRLYLDDMFAARVDLEVKGGDLANPALQLNAGTVLRVATESSNSTSGDWEYQAVGVAFIARIELDFNTPRISLDVAEKLVIDKTKARMQDDEYSTSRNGTDFNGPAWVHEVVDLSGNLFISYDHSTKQLSGGAHVGLTTVKQILVGLRNAVYSWMSSTNNPSADYDPLLQPALTFPPRRLLQALEPEARRLSEVVGAVSQALENHVPRTLEKVDSTARRLSQQYLERWPESDNLTLDINGSFDFNGLGNGNVLNGGLNVRVTGALGFGLTASLSTMETQARNWTHNLHASIDYKGKFDLGQQLAPSIQPGASMNATAAQLEDHIETSMGLTVQAQVVTDLTPAGKALVNGQLSVLPTCGVVTGQDTKVQTLEDLGVTVTLSNPQCQKCQDGPSDGDSWKGWHRRDQNGMSQLYSQCGSSDSGWTSSSWKSRQSCCVFSDSMMESVMNAVNLTMGATWTEHFDMPNISRPSDDMDILGWLSLNGIDTGSADLPTINTTSVTVGDTTTTNWTFDQGNLLLVETTKPAGGTVFRANLTVNNSLVLAAVIDGTNTATTWGATVLLDVPDSPAAATDARLVFTKTAGSQTRHDMDVIIRNGENMTKLLGAVGYWAKSTSGGNDIHTADLRITNDTSTVIGSTLAMTKGTGLNIDTNLVMTDSAGAQMTKVVLVSTEVGMVVTAAGSVQGTTNQNLGSADLEVRRHSDGTFHTGFVTVKDPDQTVVLGATSSWTKDASQGVLAAGLDNGNNTMMNASGTLPRAGSFFIGDLGVTVSDSTHYFWVNVSDGYVPSGAKKGLPGFTRGILHVGTAMDDTIINVTTYLEDPPFGTALSGAGIGVVVTMPSSNLTVETTIDLDMPFDSAGQNSNGQSVAVVQQVVQEMTTDIVMNDVTTFDADAYIAQMATAADVSASEVIIKTLEYVVDVVYTFTEAITELQAKNAVAVANDVSVDQVSVVITNARRLRSTDRRLQAVDVAATIKTADSAAVSAIKTKSTDTAAVAQAVQQVTGLNVAPVVKVAPVTKVEIVTQVIAATAPTITQDELTAMGTAVGGTVQLGEIEATTRLMTVPQSATASAARSVAPAMGTLLLLLLPALLPNE